MSELIIASKTRLNTLVNAIRTGMEISSGARSTGTYYHTKEQQTQAVRKAVSDLYKVDKTLPILLACMDDSTFFYRQEVVRHEFKQGFHNGTMALVNQEIWLDDRLQEKMLIHIINSLPFPYALRLFTSFAEEKINAPRAKRMLVSWVLSNMTDFSVVKYRRKMKEALRNAWHERGYSSIITNLHKYLLNEPHNVELLQKEVFNKTETGNTDLAKLILFVDGIGRPEWYRDTKFINAYFNVKSAQDEATFFENAKNVDFQTVTGIVNESNNPFFSSLRIGKEMRNEVKKRLLKENTVMSDDQKVRMKSLYEKVVGVARKDVDFSKVRTETIYKTRGIDINEQKEIRAEADKINLPYTKIGIIQDISLSNRGGRDSASTPAVIIEHLTKVLTKSAPNWVVESTPVSQTDLTKPFIKIVEQMPDVEAIFVLSDGYENFPYEGCLNDMVAKFRSLNPQSNLQVVHCSPYVAAEMAAKSRNLGVEIISMAVTKPSQLTTQMDVRLLDFNPKKYFEDNFGRFLNADQRIQSKMTERTL